MKINMLLSKVGGCCFQTVFVGTCRMKIAQWRERKAGFSEDVGGHTGPGRAHENKHFWPNLTFSHKKTWVAEHHDSAERARERRREKM